MIENLNTYGGEDAYDDVFLAKITARTTGTGALVGKNVYDWTEQSFDPTTGLPVLMAGGRSGTYSVDGQSPALEINDTPINALPIFALLKFRCVGDAEPVFEFAAPAIVPASSNCSIQINTCPILAWLPIVDDIPTTAGIVYVDPEDDVNYLQIQQGQTVSYQGWCGSIVSASWSGSVATFTLLDMVFATGDTITITGVTPSGYDGTYTVTGVSGLDLTVALVANPGGTGAGGMATSPGLIYCVENPDDCCPECCSPAAITSVTLALSGLGGLFVGITTPVVITCTTDGCFINGEESITVDGVTFLFSLAYNGYLGPGTSGPFVGRYEIGLNIFGDSISGATATGSNGWETGSSTDVMTATIYKECADGKPATNQVVAWSNGTDTITITLSAI